MTEEKSEVLEFLHDFISLEDLEAHIEDAYERLLPRAKALHAALSTKQEAGECARARLARSFKVGELAAFLHNTMPAKHVNKMNIGEWAALASGALDFLSITPEAGEVSRSQTAQALEAINAATGIRIEGQTLVLFFNDSQAPIKADLAIRAALSLPAPDAGWRDRLEKASVWLRREQASLILRMNRYADRFEKQPGKEPHAETVRNWVRELDDIAERIRALPLPAPPVGDGSAPAKSGPV